jgi:hypothetical protein
MKTGTFTWDTLLQDKVSQVNVPVFAVSGSGR